jgi:hypothetical protein
MELAKFLTEKYWAQGTERGMDADGGV